MGRSRRALRQDGSVEMEEGEQVGDRGSAAELRPQ